MEDGCERVRLDKDRAETKQVSKREWLKHGAEKAEVGRRWGRVESYSHSGAAGLALTNNQFPGAHHLAGGALGLWVRCFYGHRARGPMHATYGI